MTRAFPLPVPALLVALACSLCSSDSPAQIPDGHYVVSAGKGSATGFFGDGGLYVAHPRTPQDMAEIAGLPPDLTRVGYNGTELLGANCVVLHPSGDLLVGERGINGDVIELHRLSLNGFNVVAQTTIVLGAVPPGASSYGELAQMVLLDDANTLLVGCNFVAGAIGPANALQVARVDLAAGTVTPMQGVTGLGLLNALAFDPWTQTTYIGCYFSGVPVTYIRAFQPGGSITTIASGISGYPTCMAVDGNGDLLLTLSNGTHNLVRLQTQAPFAMTPLVSGWETFNALCIEPTTGQLGLCGRAFVGSPQAGVHWFDTGSATVTTLANNLISQLPRGALTGIDMVPAPRIYGTASGWGTGTGSSQVQTWTRRPHPDALPLAGGNWRLAIEWNGVNGMLNFAAVATAPSPGGLPLPVLGIDAWLDPSTLLGLLPLTVDPVTWQLTTSLPLPNGLTGAEFYLQGIHTLGAGFSATNAMHATIL